MCAMLLCVLPLIPLRTLDKKHFCWWSFLIEQTLNLWYHVYDTLLLIGRHINSVYPPRSVYPFWSRCYFGSRAAMTDCYVDMPWSLSSHAFCDSVAQGGASQKKTPHHGAHTLLRDPLILLLRPKQQLGRLERRGDGHCPTKQHSQPGQIRFRPERTLIRGTFCLKKDKPFHPETSKETPWLDSATDSVCP